MKKTNFIFTIVVCLISSYASAQIVSDFSIDGLTPLAPFVAFGPSANNDPSKGGLVEMTYPSNTDLTNVNVNFSFTSPNGGVILEPAPLPTDWSSTVENIKIQRQFNGTTINYYNVTCKVIKPATLPIEIKTGTGGNFNSSSWTSSTVGWASGCITRDRDFIQYGINKSSFVLAFTNAPDSLYYSISIDHATNTWPTTALFDVEGSADGNVWTQIRQYNQTNALPTTRANAITEPIKLDSQFRYIRWVYTNRVTVNVALENIKVTRDITSSTRQLNAQKVSTYVSDNKLKFQGQELISDLRIYNASGNLLSTHTNLDQSIDIKMLPQGLYLVKMKLTTGDYVSNKFIR
jgi:hypothetical protein